MMLLFKISESTFHSQGESEYDEIQKIALERLGCGYLSKENAMRAELGVTALLITKKLVKSIYATAVVSVSGFRCQEPPLN